MSETEPEPKPSPGSREAIEQGCGCPVLDNYHGKGFGNPPKFWINADCPLHGLEEKR